MGRIVYAALMGVVMVSLPLAPQLIGAGNTAQQSHEPANKTSIASSTMEVLGPGEGVPILSTVMKTSKPTDLVFSVTLECTILTEVTTVGNDIQNARSTIKVWVEFDGVPVVINPDEGAEDDGKVVFCDRTFEKETTLFDDEDATIRDFIETRSSHAFNWILMDSGSDTHSIVIKADLEEAATDNARAEGIIGKRTLVVEPFKFANDETFMSE